MSHGAASPHAEAKAKRTHQFFIEVMGEGAAVTRAEEIERLPIVHWKGKTLRTLRCQGRTGRGPHDCNVPESLLWSLISLRDFHCVFHPRELQPKTEM